MSLMQLPQCHGMRDLSGRPRMTGPMGESLNHTVLQNTKEHTSPAGKPAGSEGLRMSESVVPHLEDAIRVREKALRCFRQCVGQVRIR